jgi:hypothetical protein
MSSTPETALLSSGAQALLEAMRGAEPRIIEFLCEANGVGPAVADGTYTHRDLVQFFSGLLSVLRGRLDQPAEVADGIEDEFFAAVVEGVLAQKTPYSEVIAGSNTTYMALGFALFERMPASERPAALKLYTSVTSAWLGRVVDLCIAHSKAE